MNKHVLCKLSFSIGDGNNMKQVAVSQNCFKLDSNLENESNTGYKLGISRRDNCTNE